MVAAQPDIIIGSWCGKKFQPAKVRTRPGFNSVPAVANNRLYVRGRDDLFCIGKSGKSSGQ